MSGEWYGKASTRVASDATISTTAKAVYLVLVSHANALTGETWVSNSTIARWLGLSRRTVVRCINELIDREVLHRVSRFSGGAQRTNLYTLLDGIHAGAPRDTGDTPPVTSVSHEQTQ